MATQAKQWKSSVQRAIPLPSGNSAVVRRVSLDVFVRSGKIPNSLMAYVGDALGGKKPDVESLKNVDEEGIKDMLELFDQVAIMCMVDPKCHPIPKEDEPRDDETLYVDEVDLTDKQFIFQFAVGGTADVERFREEQNELVDAISKGKGPVDAAIEAVSD